MKLFVLLLFIIYLHYSNCLPKYKLAQAVHSRSDKVLKHKINPIDNDQDRLAVESSIDQISESNVGESFEQDSALLNRLRRCAFLRRIRERLSTSGLGDLFNIEDYGTFINVNSNRPNRINRPIVSHSNNEDVNHESNIHSTNNDVDFKPDIRHVNNDIVDDRQPSLLYISPVNNKPVLNHGTNSRVNNQGSSRNVYFVPSSSVAPFVEEHVFVTPPNRQKPSSSPAPIETNDDWVHNEPESPPPRDNNSAPTDNLSSNPKVNNDSPSDNGTASNSNSASNGSTAGNSVVANSSTADNSSGSNSSAENTNNST